MSPSLHAVGRGAILAALAALVVLWLRQPMPAVLWVGHMVTLALAVWRPSAGIITLAAVGPLAGWIAVQAGSPMPGSAHLEGLVLAALVGGLWHHSAGAPTRLGPAALVFSGIAIVSAMAVMPTRLIERAPDAAGWTDWARWSADYFLRSPVTAPVFYAALAAQGAALAWIIEGRTRLHPRLSIWILRCVAVSHALAALLSLDRLWSAARLRDEPWTTLGQMLATTRVHTQYDLNAGGSVLAMVLVASLAVWGRRRLVALAVTSLLALGLWLTGSRAALASAVAGIVGGALAALRRRGRLSTIQIGAALAGVALVATAAWWFYPAGRNLNTTASVQSRAILFEAGLGMVRAHPWSGVGLGRFYESSEQYGATAIGPILGVERRRENAHNNFLQVTAELGLPGLAALLWMLGAALLPSRMSSAPATGAAWRRAGLIAMLLTWITGHPLLVAEAAMMFWLIAGTVAGDHAAPTRVTPGRRLAAVVLVVMVASLPMRTQGIRQEADLEHVGRGLSVWDVSPDGVRMRTAGDRFSLFLPAGAPILLPMRSAAGVAPQRYDVHVAQRRIDEVAITPDEWRQVRLRVPESPNRFVEVVFTRRAEPAPCGACVLVGRPVRP